MFDWFTKKDKEELIDAIEEEHNNNNENYVKMNEKDKGAYIGKNIYTNDGTVDDFSKKSTFVHKILKNSFVDALLMKFVSKHRDKLMKDVPEGYQFEKLKLFNDAYGRALNTWCGKYRAFSNNKIRTKEELEADFNSFKNDSRLAILKELYITICANDSAYLEFNNIFMYELANQCKKLEPHHLLYIDQNINDVKYFILVDRFTPETKELAKHLVDGYIRAAEVVTNPDGTVELKVWDSRMPSFVKNTDLPQ